MKAMSSEPATPLLPYVSVLIPTLNAGRTLDLCLASIRLQDYPRERLQIILADAGSHDNTLDLARQYGVDKIVPNPLKTGEAGKTEAAKAADGEILALIDSDNILPDAHWLSQMVAPFADGSIIASEPLEYTCRPEDPELTRYFALLGMNDPLCFFIGNYDRLCTLSGKWTGLNLETEDCEGWLKVRIQANRPVPTIGANGFLIRKSALTAVNWSPYWFDVDVLRDAARHAPQQAINVAKVKCGIVHLYCRTLDEFARKQERRVRDFLFFSNDRKRVEVPGEKRQKLIGIFKFTLATVTIIPLLLQRAKGARLHPDAAWRMHLPVCAVTLKQYAFGVIRKLLGFKQAPVSRENWRQ